MGGWGVITPILHLVYIKVRRKLIIQKYLASLNNNISSLCVLAHSTIQNNPIIQRHIWIVCLYLLCISQLCSIPNLAI